MLPIAISSDAALVRVAEQLLGGLIPAADCEVRRLEQRGGGRDARSGQGELIAEAPVRRQVEVQVEFEVAADVRDPGVPEREQVLRREAGDSDIVDREGAHPRDRAADADERLLECVQPGHLVRVQFQGDRDDGIHSLAQQEVLEHAAAFVVVPGEAVEGEVEAAAEQGLLRTLDDVGEEPAVEERHDDADVLHST